MKHIAYSCFATVEATSTYVRKVNCFTRVSFLCFSLRAFAMVVDEAGGNEPPPAKRQREASFKNLFLCRHGTTTWNLKKMWQGETDTELAEQGIAQAKATAELLAERLPGSTRVILTSNLKRARVTAEIYAARLGCEVVEDPGLREPCLGKFEGMTADEIYSQHAALFKRLEQMGQEERMREPYFEGLESPLDTSTRAEAAVRRAAEKLNGDPDATVLLVTHSKVLEALLAKVFGKFYEGIVTKPGAFFHWKYSEQGEHELGELHQISFEDHLVEQ
eukprot:TRINITY_DN32597_c0_g1_i1.p1 TRINITY_DN32597_c0_g1~~TRINITY_DN32597_c0_g1_i1.p1  ORF type:complete len:276 (+),score=63.99 TRINITY_DN32597_c0_g1_i1:101-928(+)